MSTRLQELVERLGAHLSGDPNLEISGVAPLETAGPDQISFLSDSRLRTRAGQTRAAALILGAGDAATLDPAYAGARVICANPYAGFARAAQWFAAINAQKPAAGIHPSACVDASAEISASAHLGPHVVVEAGASIGDDVVLDAGCFVGRNARIGTATHLFARATVHAGCVIGARGILHSGAVIGADGFGFAEENGHWIKIPQTGAVLIGDDVEIGANTTVDRGALSDTIIEDGVKLDNQIQIGHNCRIGAHTAMAGCVGVAGSATIGRHCTFGGAAMVLGHLTIADHVHISSGSMVARSIHEPGLYTGFYPLAKNAEWEKSAVIVRRLASMRGKIRDLERTIKTLTEKNNEKPEY